MNNIIGLKDLRENTEKYISQVKKGKQFTVVRKSQPIFNITPTDEWDDGEVWETLDLTKIRRGGVPAKELIKILGRIDR